MDQWRLLIHTEQGRCQDRRYLHGHVRTLAESVAAAAKATGAEVDLFQIPEILSEEVRGKMHAAPRAEYPDVTAEALEKYDGFLIGGPTRYGRMPAAVSAFFDTTGGQWFTGKYAGKFGGVFTSTASQHGGQETTALTTIPFFAHHGIAYVPAGFGCPELTDNSEIVGGSAYGAAAIAGGDGSRAVTEKELSIAKAQGKNFATLVSQFVAGKSALERAAAAPVNAATATAPVGIEQGAPVLGKAIPVETQPYEVAETASAPEPKVEAPVAEKEPVVEEPTVAAATPVKEETPVAAAPAPVEKVAQKPATAPKKEKKGIFSMCCGGAAKNYD
ncbi:hypothetical protein JCM11641_005874 [Rhodosporidiobolus odoratus]